MTITQSLRSINTYPIPLDTIKDITEARGLNSDTEATADMRIKASYRLAKADVLMWLAKAPNISQAGISYSFSDDERMMFKNQAQGIYDDCGDVKSSFSKFGYKGELF